MRITLVTLGAAHKLEWLFAIHMWTFKYETMRGTLCTPGVQLEPVSRPPDQHQDQWQCHPHSAPKAKPSSACTGAMIHSPSPLCLWPLFECDKRATREDRPSKRACAYEHAHTSTVLAARASRPARLHHQAAPHASLRRRRPGLPAHLAGGVPTGRRAGIPSGHP